MVGVLSTVRGLGDGIESLFKPFLDAANDGVAETDQLKFPQVAKNILNAFFSGGVLSSFSERVCSDTESAGNVGFHERLAVGGGQNWAEYVSQPLGLSSESVLALHKAIAPLDDRRRAAAWKAIGLAEPEALHEVERLAASGPTLKSSLLLATTDEHNCFVHMGTEGYIARGFQSGEAGFDLEAGTVKVGLNLTFESRLTIVGEEPVIERRQAQPGANGFAPLARGFGNGVNGQRQITTGGICASPQCKDQWVSGVGKITTLIAMRAKVQSNIPQKLKDVLPGLGVDAGFHTITAFTFPFLHYPREEPTGIPGR